MDTELGFKGNIRLDRCNFAFATILVFALVSGCGKSAHSVAAGNSGLFTTAPMKDEWNTAMAAMQTNGFFIAATTLNKMRLENPAPTPDQLNAINGTIKTLNQEMLDLANKGDANARSALEQLRTGQSRGR